MTQRKGDEVTVFSYDSILENMHTNWHIQSYLIGNFCTVKSKKPIQNLMYIDNKKILIIDSTCIFTKKIQPDILIVIQSPKLNMQRLLKTVKPKVVVVDDSNFKSYVQLWKESCRKEKIPFHATCEKGFYKI
jgi:competence protein ComEC